MCPLPSLSRRPGLRSSSLAYSPSVLGEPTAVTVRFTCNWATNPQDSVNVVLAGFTAPNQNFSLGRLSGVNAESFSPTESSWALSDRTLVLVFAATVPPHDAQSVVVSSDSTWSLSLPSATHPRCVLAAKYEAVQVWLMDADKSVDKRPDDLARSENPTNFGR